MAISLKGDNQCLRFFFIEIVTTKKIACKTVSTRCVWPGRPSHAQTCLELPGVNLVGLGGMSALKIT